MEDSQLQNTSLLHWGLVSKYRSQLFGFAILWIMCMHSREFTPLLDDAILSQYILYDGIILVGGVGVDIFLFLSGVGLYYAQEKHPTLGQFYAKRYKRLLLPYLVIGTAFWVFKDLAVRGDPGQFWADFTFASFFTDGVGMFWYIALMIPLYLLAPVFYRISKSRYDHGFVVGAFVVCLVANYLLSLWTPEFFDHCDKAVTRVFIFILGCHFGPVVAEDRPMNRKWALFALVALTSHGLFSALARASDGWFSTILASRIWHNAAGFALCILIPVALEVLQSPFLNRLLGFFGEISLELYLSHMALKSVVKTLCPDFTGWSTLQCLLVYGGVLVVSVGFSILFHQLQGMIESALSHSHLKQKGAFLL